jgi:tRNA isopentenyl-2-thiomethyl-A-37 hydroxylase MiaE
MPLALSRKIRKRRIGNRIDIIAREELEHLQMVHDLIKKQRTWDVNVGPLCK